MDTEAGTGVAGKLLIAMPNIGDPRFEGAVILMCLHTADQAMGVIVNKPKPELSMDDVLEHLGIEVSSASAAARAQVLDGGPVRPDRGFVLHSPDYAAPDATQPITDLVALTTTRDVLEAIAGPAAPARFTLALGCSGWGAGQLEAELRGAAWLVADPDEAIVFGDDHATKWVRAIKSLGLDPAQIGGEAGCA